MKKRRFVSVFLAICFLWGTLYLLQRLVTPKYMTSIREGALISEYYREEIKKHDVIFIGDCEVYGNFSPIALWENYGITSFIRGSPQQLVWQSYYLLEETLKYEKPEIVVFNVLAMKYNEPQNEAYNRMTLDGMRWSTSKVRSINSSMLDDENFIEYLFPLLRFHSRWRQLTLEDFKYIFSSNQISHNGYYMRVDVKPATTFPTPRRLPTYQFGDKVYYYLDKMVELTKRNGIELILIKAPTLYPHWYDQWDLQMQEYAQKNGLLYINFLNHIEEMELDFTKDTYNAGLNMNVWGAEKLSKYFGELLVEMYGLTDHRKDEILSRVWDEKIDFYYYMMNKQFEEIERYGHLKNF